MAATRVLIVEDEIFTALDLEEALVEAGYQVAGIACDREEAVALGSHADVALVDINLRDGPTGVLIGGDLAGQFGVQVLFLTANATAVAASAAGALGCLEKPCMTAAVCAAVNYAATRRDPPQSLRLFH